MSNINQIVDQLKKDNFVIIKNFFDRNRQIAEYSDYVVAFVPEGVISNGTMNTIEHSQNLNKKVIILN